MAERSTGGRTGLVWVAAALPVLLVAAVVGGWFYANGGWGAAGGAASGGGAGGEAGELPGTGPPTLRVGADYYLFAKTIELYPRRPGDRPWDRMGDSAPDVQYSITWQGHVVFESTIREDTLLATWDGISLDVRKALLEGEVEPGQAVNRAALINVTADGKVILNVWDKDTVGFGSDGAGEVRLKLTELFEGDNIIALDPSASNGIKRIVLRATGTDQPMDNLLEAIAAP